MSHNYDNWERLVRVVLRRQHDRELALRDSQDLSTITSLSSSFASLSRFDFNHPIVPEHENLLKPLYHSRLRFDQREWKTTNRTREDQWIVDRSASMIFFLDHRTGKHCFSLEARRRTIGKTSLISKINMQMLSADTQYAAYLVFEIAGHEATSLQHPPDSVVNISYGADSEEMTHSATSVIKIAFEKPYKGRNPIRKEHRIYFGHGETTLDGWNKIQVGEFYVDKSIKAMVNVEIRKFSGPLKESLNVHKIEFLPLKPKPLLQTNSS